ncbi:MAG TPA: division/cell wall cluster transcriptional repressor MraZ [Patescibacteria group bacterium]
MFLGEYEHTIDQKGRLAIPAKFRTALGEGAVIARGLDNCLTLYPKKEWERLAERVASLPTTDANARSFARFILAGAVDVEADKQGRVILPAYLRQYAELGANVIVAGLYNRVEIWDKARWSDYSADAQANSSDVASRLSDLGI